MPTMIQPPFRHGPACHMCTSNHAQHEPARCNGYARCQKSPSRLILPQRRRPLRRRWAGTCRRYRRAGCRSQRRVSHASMNRDKVVEPPLCGLSLLSAGGRRLLASKQSRLPPTTSARPSCGARTHSCRPRVVLVHCHCRQCIAMGGGHTRKRSKTGHPGETTESCRPPPSSPYAPATATRTT